MQEVAHALAPAVQEVAAARGQRLANRQARKRALVLLRRRQRSFRAARQPVGGELGVRYFNTQKSRVYATGHLASYSDGLRRAAIDFYRSLPPQWRAEGVSISMRYDFYASNETDSHGEFPYPERIRAFQFAQRYDGDGEELQAYYDHTMTRLNATIRQDDKGRRVVGLQGLLDVVESHLMNRINLRELYSVLDTDEAWRGNAASVLSAKPCRFQCASAQTGPYRRSIWRSPQLPLSGNLRPKRLWRQ